MCTKRKYFFYVYFGDIEPSARGFRATLTEGEPFI